MSAPTTLWEAQRAGEDDSPIRCTRCGNHDYPDEMLETEDGPICQPCAEVIEEAT